MLQAKPEIIGVTALGIALGVLVARQLLSSPPKIVGDKSLKVNHVFTTTDQQQGNFLPIKHELEAFNLTLLEGSLPESMDGIFIRNGPNPLGPADAFHWFEGWGMVSCPGMY